jgi:phosphoribosylanthranilate isomerase
VQQTHRTRVKICGITRVEDALAAAEAGADAIGLVFYAGSKRVVSLQQAQTIVASVPPFVTVVGLFVNAARNEIEAVLSAIPLGLLQFHGDESADYCSSFRRPFIKAVRMKAGVDLDAASQGFDQAQGLLLDAWDAGSFGGTGQTFDWKNARPTAARSRIIVAGGLTPANVAEAISTARPWAVDVSSGVELAPGIKSAALMQSFISEVQRV